MNYGRDLVIDDLVSSILYDKDKFVIIVTIFRDIPKYCLCNFLSSIYDVGLNV